MKKKPSELFDVPSPAVARALGTEPYKGASYRKGFLAGSKEGFGIGFTAGLREARLLQPDLPDHICRFNDAPQVCDCFLEALSSWDEKISKVMEKKI